MRFQQLNLLHEFPWPNGSFDVVHLRLILFHVGSDLLVLILIAQLNYYAQIPDALRFLERVTALLKPGGWLLIEDGCVIEFPRASGPVQAKRNEITSAFMVSKGLDPQIGANVADAVRATFEFSEVNIRQVLLTFTPLPEGVSAVCAALPWCLADHHRSPLASSRGDHAELCHPRDNALHQ